MNKKSIILFDLDGTLTDPKKGITKSVGYSLSKFDIKVENLDDLVCFIGPPLRESYQRFYGLNDMQAETAVAFYREYFSVKGMYENFLYSGIANLLEKLYNQKKQLILATSKAAVYAVKILEHFNLSQYFSFVSGCELDGRRSKKAEVIKYAFENMGITANNDVVMIGDREHDIIGAKENNIDSIGVLYGYGSLQELKNAGATCIAGTVKDLSKLLL